MVPKTMLVVPGKRLSVPRLLKRSVQVAAAVTLTAVLVLAVLVSNGLLVPRGRSASSINVWLGFIQRTDILATMVLTAIVTVLFLNWQRGQERR